MPRLSAHFVPLVLARLLLLRLDNRRVIREMRSFAQIQEICENSYSQWMVQSPRRWPSQSVFRAGRIIHCICARICDSLKRGWWPFNAPVVVRLGSGTLLAHSSGPCSGSDSQLGGHSEAKVQFGIYNLLHSGSLIYRSGVGGLDTERFGGNVCNRRHRHWIGEVDEAQTSLATQVTRNLELEGHLWIVEGQFRYSNWVSWCNRTD